MSQNDIVIDAETGEIVERDDPWERHRRIVALRNQAENSFLQLGQELYWFEKRKQFQALGHPTFDSYIADPDVDIARRTAFRLKGVYLTYSENLRVPPVALLPAGYSKLYMMHKHMTAANVEEWVATASAVSRSDLKLLLEQAFGKEQPPLPPGQFRVIYADPPWQYSNVGLGGAAEKHYSTMRTDAVAEMEIEARAGADAALFLWSTNSHIADALHVISSWGFEYKANLVWIKDKPSYGKLAFYFRGQHELLMLAIRGSMPPQADPLPVSILTAPKREHSRKPQEAYDIIETMYAGPYLELFARGIPRTGWTTWGNEVQ